MEVKLYQAQSVADGVLFGFMLVGALCVALGLVLVVMGFKLSKASKNLNKGDQ